MNTRKIVGIPNSQNFVLANNSNNKVVVKKGRSIFIHLSLSFVGFFLGLTLFVVLGSFFQSFSLLTYLSQFTDGNDNQLGSFFLPQTKGRREKERERKRKGKEEEGKEKGKGEREREIGSEALAETEKIANAPAGKRTRDPSKRGWCSTIEPPRQAISPASLFEILSALPPLHNIGIIQCPQLTNPLRSGNPSRSPLCITHGLKE